jgi:hypothetical protein
MINYSWAIYNFSVLNFCNCRIIFEYYIGLYQYGSNNHRDSIHIDWQGSVAEKLRAKLTAKNSAVS